MDGGLPYFFVLTKPSQFNPRTKGVADSRLFGLTGSQSLFLDVPLVDR